MFIELERDRRIDVDRHQVDFGNAITTGPTAAIVQRGTERHKHANAGRKLVIDLVGQVHGRSHNSARSKSTAVITPGGTIQEVDRTFVRVVRIRNHHGQAAGKVVALQARHASRIVEPDCRKWWKRERCRRPNR